MRSIAVSTEVFSKLWALRKAGEETEDDILRRLLDCPPTQSNRASGVSWPTPTLSEGFVDLRNGARFAEGFAIFRTYKGQKFVARVVQGRWLLENTGTVYDSLNTLNSAIAAGAENVWRTWFYGTDDGQVHAINEIRDPSKIASRKGLSLQTDTAHH
jgi:hypothetical protein